MFFDAPGGHAVFKDLLANSKSKFKWKLSYYCLMPNHFHLLGQIELGEALPKLMQYLLFEYSRWYRLGQLYVGHVWQGRYKSPLIEQESYFLECGRYIKRNPIRAKIVENTEDYTWSSYRHYALGERDSLIDDDPYYEQLGRDAEERQKRYQDFVKIEGPYG